MVSRLIHYGVDEHGRIDALRNAGYTVESCSSLSEFRWVLYPGLRADAVVFTELPGEPPHNAMSLARAQRSPLVLFQGRTPHYDRSEFDLVVHALASPTQWLFDIARLIENNACLAPGSPAQWMESPKLRGKDATAGAKIMPEFGGSHRVRSGNHAFQPGFSQSAANQLMSGTLARPKGFLGSLGLDAMCDLSAKLRFSACPAGAVLFAEEQLPDAVYFVLAGQAKLSVNASDGKRFIVYLAGPGEMLGLASAFTSCAHEVTAETFYPCDLASVDCVDFVRFLGKHPEAFQAAASELARGYNQACVRLRTMGVSLTVTARMAGLLLEWSATGYETDRGKQIHMALTHVEIGQCIGTTRESVTRVLNDFQQRRIIDQRGSIITILDRAALESSAALR
jgi:CRP/FNR family transcriptional regulator, cyclic AMP receptor protein